MADGSVPIVLSPEPFARTTTYVEAPAGCTVRTMLTSAVARGHLKLDDLARTNVYVDGVRLNREDALTMVLREGQVINVVVEPLGGGSGGKKEIGQILLTIAVIAVSMWVGGPAGPLNAWPMLARQVAAAAILTAGQMAIAAIFKPETNVTKTNDRYALSAASNQYRQWGSMPLALGEVVVAPDLAVKTFTQAHGEDQWIYGILGLHYGPCTADDLKIGDTLVSSMGSSDVRVAYHLAPGPRTFSIVANDTDQLDLQEELQATVSGSTPVIRAGSAEGELFEFDFFMPQGLYFAKDDGRKIAASLTVTIRYRPVDQNGVPTGAGAWQSGLTIPLTSSSSDPWRFTRSISLPLGRYEFEIVRSRLEDTNAKRKTDIGLTAIRAIAFRKPVADETLSLIEFAVRASALNQGSLAPLTCRITPICETWNGTTWSAPAPTSNPAAVARWLMTGPAPALPLTSPQADTGLRTWAALCDQYNWKAHLYLTEDRKQDAVLQLLGMNGRASLFWDGTQLVASPWTEKPAPRQLFAGSNLKDHHWEIVFPDPVHALRVEFQNIDQGGEADEVYVYADGYGETANPANGIEAATLVEALRLEGQQTIERAYRDGRWNLAARLHQRRVDSWSTDIEHIVCRFGDRVRLAWDRVGTANATVRNRIWSGGLVSGLRLSQPVRMEPGRAYALDLRLPGQVLTGVPVVNPATTEPVVTRTVSFADLRSANVSPRGGDLVAFGEPQRISEDVEVIGITPGPDLTATLVGIRYVAPLLMAAETGPIPPLQSRLTRDRSMDPPSPTLLGWQADAEGVRIGFSMPSWRGSPITGFTVRWRQTPAAGQTSAWVPLPDLPANAMTAVLPPLRELPAEGTNVTSAQVQIVAVTADGRASPALQVTVQEAAIQQPPSGDWTVSKLTEGPDGSQQSGFLVIGLVGSINPRRVTVEYGASVDGPWDAAFDGPPVQGVVRAPILGMQPGAQCWIAITYWTAQASAPSKRRVLGPYTAPGLVAGDVSPTAPGLSQIRSDIQAAFGDISDVSALVGEARVDLDRHDGEIAAAQGRIDAQAADILALDAGLDGVTRIVDEHTVQIDSKASRTVVDAEILRLDGVVAVNASQADALIDLESNKVALSEYDLLKAEVEAARAGAPSLLAQIAFLQDVDLDLLNNKASTAALNIQTSRIDDAVATNASQALTLVDLENNKVGASIFDSLRAEVEAARAGKPSLLAQIQGLKAVDLDLEANKASTTTVESLTARVGSAEGDIIHLSDVQASEALIRAAQIDALTARTNWSANLIDNPNGAAGFRGWSKEGGPNTDAINDPEVGHIFVVGDYMVSQVYPASPGQKHSLGYNASPVGGGHVRLQYVTSGGLVEGVRVDNTLAEKVERRRSIAPGTAPAGTTGFRLVVGPPAGGVLPVWAIKVNFGDVATDFSDDYSAAVLEAEASITKAAVLDLEGQQALARVEIVADAEGGKPARGRWVSSTLGSYIAFEAPYIFWGENTVFVDASDTLETTVGDYIRVLALGAPFGAASNLVEWWGPKTVARGAMTPANGLNGRMTTAPYVFDNVVSIQASALLSSIAVNGAAGTTDDTNWTTWCTASYSNLPSGGLFKLFAEASANPGMTIEGLGSSFDGEFRVQQAGATIATGSVSAFASGGDASLALLMPTAPIIPAATGPTSLVLQVRRASGSNYIGGSGAHITFYAEWTKAG